MVNKFVSLSVLKILLVLSLLFLIPTKAMALSAFPGATGFGSQTVGGRGGNILAVTNLNDSGSGSLRDALSSTGPRTIIFKVGGLLTLTSPLYLNNPFITIAGQTAPGNGFAIRGAPLLIRTHDVIVRGMQFRIGDQIGVKPSERDGLSLWGDANHEVYNVVIDHNSIAWGVDENLSTWDDTNSGKIHDVTFSHNITAEALYDSIHIDEGASTTAPHSMGFLVGGGTKNISILNNLFASNNDRNPAVQSGTTVELINNVVYNWGLHPFSLYGGKVNAIGNYFINTAGSTDWVGLSGIHCEGSIEKIYEENNLGPGGSDWDTTVCTGNLEANVKSTTLTFAGSGHNPLTPTEAYDDVIKNAGALRDKVDDRIIDYVVKRTKPTATWRVNSQDEVGGWPSYPSGSPPSDIDSDNLPDNFETLQAKNLDPQDSSNTGYTWIEEYINSYFQATSTPNAGDLNDDGHVDHYDYHLLIAKYGNPYTIADFNAIVNNYGK